MLQASSLALIGMLTVVGCGGSDTPSTTKKDAAPDGIGGTTPTGVVKVDKAVLDFGSIDIGSTSTAQTVNVQVSVAAVAINATVTGSGFAISGTTCAPVQAVGACTISVKFAPASIGAATGTLAIGNAAVALSGAGQNAGTFSVTDRVDLGTLLVGATASAVVQVVPSPSVTGLTCVASGSNLTLASQTCAATGAIAAPCTFTFTFKAATAGVKSDAVVCSAGGTVKQTTVAATVVTPAALTINPPTATFTASVGGTYVATFNVSNSGGSPTGNLSATISAGATDFAITSNDCVVPLASLAICKIQVTFKPASVGAKTGTLTVADATVGTVPATAALTGTAIAATALAITPATSDFGTVEAPATKTTNFTIKNNGGTASDAIVIGGGSAEFVVDAALCNNLPLAPGASCTFTVTFKPATAGAKTAAIIATVNGVASATAQVTGTGTVKGTPVLAVSPPTLDFGSITVGTTKGPLSLTVTNSGTAATGVLSVVKKDSTSSVGGASQFTFTSPDCNGASLEPGESCTVAVTYSPTITGSASAILTISDGAVSSANGTVIGIALTIPTLSISCTPGAFDSTVVGQTSANVICTIKNVVTIGGAGQAPQESGAITAAVTGDFTIVTNACTASLQPNESCTVAVAFKPTAKGTRTGKLTVTSANRGANDQTLTATGWLPVQVEAYSPSLITASNPTGHVTSLYDFGNAAMGSSASAADATKVLTLAVYVHASVGNLAISGTDLQFGNATAAADFTGANFASGTYSIGGVSVVNPTACASISTVAPTPNANPYCYMTIDFTPKSKTLKSNTFKAAGADGTSSDTVAMQGTGTGPLTINPSPLTFDAVAVGTSGSQVLTLTVKNNAASSATAATIAITGANAANFVLVTDNISNQTIGGGASVSVPIRLTVPAGAAVGALAATVTVTATIAGVSETTTATLAGSAVTGAGITATLNGAFADTVVTGTSAPVTVTVRNTGALATDVLTATLGGAGDFTITAPSGQSQGTCVIGTTKLDPGTSCDLKVWFQPSAGLGVSKRSNTLAIGSAVGGTVVLTLTGNATGLLAVTPATQDLGTFALGEAQPTVKTFTITNNGGTSVTPTVEIINDTNLGQTGAGEIAVKTNNCTTIGAAGSTSPLPYCTVDVWMLTNSSALPGLRAATVKVTGTAGSTQAGTATAIVTGTAAKKASLKFTPVDTAVVTKSASTVDRDFGKVVRGSSSAPQTFIVTNVGGFDASALAVSFYDLTSDGLTASTTKHAKTSDLTVGGTCLGDGAAVKAGQSCTITVAFSPTACAYPPPAGCPFTTTQLGNSSDGGTGYGVQMVITATNGTPTAGEPGPRLYGDSIDTNAANIVGSNGLAAYDFGAGTIGTGSTKMFTFRNATTSPITLASGSPVAYTVANVSHGAGVGTGAANIVTSVYGGTNNEFAIAPTSAWPAGTPTTKACTAAAVAAGDYCLFGVTWTPNTANGTGTREVSFGVGGASISLFGRVLTSASLVALPYPLAATTSTALDFGTPVQGVDSLTKTLTIINVGELATTADLKIVNPSASTVAGQVKVMTGTTCQGSNSALASLGTCVLNLAVLPADVNAQNDAAGVKDIALATDASSTSLMMNGATIKAKWDGRPGSALTAAPTALAFDGTGSAYPGTAILSNGTALTLTITNAAGAPDTGPLSIATSSADFYIDPTYAPTTPVSCLDSSLAFTGLTGSGGTASCRIRVVFSPVALATPAKTGTLTVKSAATADLTVQLSGTALPSITVGATAASGATFAGTTAAASASLLYPATSVNGPYTDQLFTFTKATGSPATSNLSASLSGTNADQFRIVDDKCTGVSLKASAASCTVTVRFAPTTATAGKVATLTVIDPLSGTPANSVSVALSGNGNP